MIRYGHIREISDMTWFSKRRRLGHWPRAMRTGKILASKVALGHNKDDIIETFLLNTFYAGEISTMIPHQVLFGGKLAIVRPLALVDEAKIRAYAELHGLPLVKDNCPTRGTTRRAEIKGLLDELDRRDRRIKKNIFAALSNVKGEYLLDGNGYRR